MSDDEDIMILGRNQQHQAKQTAQQRVIALLEVVYRRFLRSIQSPIQQQFRSDGRNGYGLKTFLSAFESSTRPFGEVFS
jgi:hypothetical protein